MRPWLGLWGMLLGGSLTQCTPQAGATSAPDGTRPSGTGRGVVTLRFVNRTQQDLYVETTYDLPLVIEGEGGLIKRRRFCHALCGEACQCNTCGSPMSSTRRIAVGEAYDVEWRGEDYEEGSCSQGDQTCGCDQPIAAEAGTYSVTLRASTGVSSADGAAGDAVDPGVLMGASPTGSACVARGKVLLSDSPSTFELPFRCDER